MDSNFLKRAFEWADDVVDAAQSPATKLASILLPILAPLVPAFITGIRMHGMYVTLIAGRFPDWVATIGAVVTALVLELLGWVGTIALVRNIYQWVKTSRDEYWVPALMSFIAYVFYIGDMWAVNSQRTSADNILLFLSLFSVPAGFMFAVMLVTGEDKKEAEVIRQERREDRLKSKMIKAGINPLQYASTTNGVAIQKTKVDWRELTKEQKRAVRSLPVKTIMDEYGIGESTAFRWKKWSESV